MSLDIAYLSNAGARRANQDCVGYAQAGETYCLTVADGLGGYRYGEYASSLAVQSVRRSFLAEPIANEETLRRHLWQAARCLCDAAAADPALQTMRTTLCAAYLNGKGIAAGHVGDSRIYLMRGGEVFFISRDHSLVMQMVERGELRPEQIRGHPKRNVVTSALGRNLPPRLDTFRLAPALAAGDGLLLCTDGFWELILEEEMAGCLRASGSAGEWLSRMEQRVANRQTARSDNYTCLAAMRGESSAAKSDSGHL